MMDPATPEETEQNAARLDLLRRYAASNDPESQAVLLQRLVATLDPDQLKAAFVRLASLVNEQRPADLLSPAEAADYELLLPAALSGSLPEASPEYARFLSIVDRWGAEYEDLRSILDAGNAERLPEKTTRFPLQRLDFLSQLDTDANTSASAEARTAMDGSWLDNARDSAQRVWDEALDFGYRVARTLGRARLSFPFAPAPITSGRGNTGAEGLDIDADNRELLAVIIEPDAENGLGEIYELTISAQRNSPTTCRLIVSLSSPERVGNAGGIKGSIELKSDDEVVFTLDDAGLATVPAVYIAGLEDMTVTITLPTAPGL